MERNAYVYVKWNDGENSLNYPNVDHYFVGRMWVYTAKDRHYPGFNGKLGFF